MKRLVYMTLVLAIIVTGLVFLNKQEGNTGKKNKKQTVLTSLNPSFSIASAITEGSNIEIKQVFTSPTHMEGQGRWFTENSENFSALAKKADAVITISGVWKNDPLYAYTRRYNIRAININAAEPIDPQIAGVSKLVKPSGYFGKEKISSRIAIGENTEELSPFIWLSISNAAKMAELISLDLKRISPEDSEIIEENLTSLKGLLFELKTKYETALLNAEAFSVIALTPDLVYLTDDLNIYVSEYMLKDGYFWTDEDLKYIEEIIKDYDTKIIVSCYKPGNKITSSIRKAGARLVLLDNMDKASKLENPETYYIETMETNLKKLLEAFKETGA